MAKDRFGKPRVDLCQFRQRVANGSLADVEVIVIGPLAPLMRADADAHTQPQAREAEKRRSLVFGERVFGVVALDDFSRGGQRVGLVQNGVSDCDGKIGHSEAVDHISEINNTYAVLAPRAEISPAGAYDHVVIVRVVMNRALAKLGQYRRDVTLELGGEL